MQKTLPIPQIHAAMTEIADVFTRVCEEVLDARNEWLSGGVQRMLGYEPRGNSPSSCAAHRMPPARDTA